MEGDMALKGCTCVAPSRFHEAHAIKSWAPILLISHTQVVSALERCHRACAILPPGEKKSWFSKASSLIRFILQKFRMLKMHSCMRAQVKKNLTGAEWREIMQVLSAMVLPEAKDEEEEEDCSEGDEDEKKEKDGEQASAQLPHKNWVVYDMSALADMVVSSPEQAT
eukprot:6454797-Amphidinium_carterae.1